MEESTQVQQDMRSLDQMLFDTFATITDEGIFEINDLLSKHHDETPTIQYTDIIDTSKPPDVLLSSDPYLSESFHTRRISASSYNDEGISLSPSSTQQSPSSVQQSPEMLAANSPDSKTSVESIMSPPELQTDLVPSILTEALQEAEVIERPRQTKKNSNEGASHCYVCREKAGKHSYYGGRVCPSCRAFFRRAVQSKYYEIFFCTKGEACEINLKTRRSCQYCRFKKCLESGMRIAWVLPDGERNRRFNKLNKVAYRNDLAAIDSAVATIKKEPVMALTGEELKVIEQSVLKMRQTCSEKFDDIISTDAHLIAEIGAYGYFGGCVNYDFFRRFNYMLTLFSQNLFWKLKDIDDIPRNDQLSLVRINGPVINRFKNAAILVDPDNCFMARIDNLIRAGSHPLFRELKTKLEAANIHETKKPHLGYEQMYCSPWAPTRELEEKFEDRMERMKQWPRENVGGPVDEVMLTLIKMIMMFNTDEVEFEAPKAKQLCEQIQLRYTMLLHRYLQNKNRETANAKLSNGLMMISYAKEAEEITQTRLPI